VFDEVRQRLRARVIAVGDHTFIPSRLVADTDDGLYTVNLDGGTIASRSERVRWERTFFDGLAEAALRGELVARVVPLAPR